MAQLTHKQIVNVDYRATTWKTLYRAGAIAPMIALLFYFLQLPIIIFGEPYPVTIEDWFSLIQRSKILGFLYLNALDIFSVALLGIMFLALYIALRQKNESLMIIAVYLAFVGVVTFIVPRLAMLSIIPLSDLYAGAITNTQREALLAAGESLSALGTATPQTLGYFFMAVAGFIISMVILKGSPFSKASAYVGIFAFVITVANDLSMILVPSFAEILMPLNGLLWLTWWMMISGGLLQLTRNSTKGKG